MADKVRFSELDALNHVNNVVYLEWFEALRVRYFRDYGISPYDGAGPRLVLRTQEAAYLKPMFLDDAYVVVARTAAFRRTSFRMDYAVYSDSLCATSSAIVVQVSPDGQTKVPLTGAQREVFATRDGARAEQLDE